MSEVPAFIEVLPDDFKPVEECSYDELMAAVEALMAHSVMSARDAVTDAERDGRSPVSAEFMSKSTEQMDLAKSLQALAEQRRGMAP